MGLPNEDTTKRNNMGAGATAALGIGTAIGEEAGKLIFGGLAQKQQLKGQKQALEQQNAASYDYWLKTNYSAQKGQMKEAGLNPALMYGMGGGAGGQRASGGAMPTAATTQGMGIAQKAQLALLQAQLENIKADTENKKAEVPVKGATVPKLVAEEKNISTETKGKEITNKINDVERSIREGLSLTEYGARGTELEARNAVADNLLTMYDAGKLKEQSMAEVEKLIIGNAKSREEIKNIQKQFDILESNLKGKNIENVIAEIEMKLQQATGLDKTSPYWAKALGRMFALYFGGK